jgi:hypothetical protein
MLNFSPESCLKRAHAQLEINAAENDRYACLELRQCLESLAYRKLKAYRLRVPQSLISKWQPVQIISTITELEPNSQYDSETAFFSEDKDGKPVKHLMTISQKEITAKFINKRYHKLGYYLHTPTVEKEKKKFNQKRFYEYLLKLGKELDVYASQNSYGTFANTLNLECKYCGHLTDRNTESLLVGSVVECFNTQCRAQYIIEAINDNVYSYKPYEAEIKCDCGKSNFLPGHQISVGSRLTCWNCEAKYHFSKVWKVEKITRNVEQIGRSEKHDLGMDTRRIHD